MLSNDLEIILFGMFCSKNHTAGTKTPSQIQHILVTGRALVPS